MKMIALVVLLSVVTGCHLFGVRHGHSHGHGSYNDRGHHSQHSRGHSRSRDY